MSFLEFVKSGNSGSALTVRNLWTRSVY